MTTGNNRKSASSKKLHTQQKKKIQRQRKIIRGTVYAIMAAVMLFLCYIRISQMARYVELNDEIAAVNRKYETMRAENDAYEYQIKNMVDLKTIIDKATNEYGMVRAEHDQIIEYKDNDDEYIVKMSELPEP